MATAAIYVRISRDDRNTQLGIDRQEQACRDLAARNGLEVGQVYADNDQSAYSKKRKLPARETLFADIERGAVRHLVVYHPDRLSRRNVDLERIVDLFERRPVRVHTVTAGDWDLSTATGRMVARVVGAAAQGESERMGERIKLRWQQNAARCLPHGEPPYGYRATRDHENKVTEWTIDPVEGPIIKTMVDQVLAGASLSELARNLTAEGVVTRRGGIWRPATLHQNLRNPTIAGLRHHHGEIVGRGTWEPIIDVATRDRLMAVIADPKRKRSKPPRRALLTGLLYSEFGSRMCGGPILYGRTVYTVRRDQPGPWVQIAEDAVDEFVVEAVLQRTDHAKFAASETAVIDPAADEVAALEAELAEVADLRGEGQITLAEYVRIRSGIVARLDEARSRLVSQPTSTMPPLLQKRGALRKQWGAMSVPERRRVLAAVIERVVISKAERGRHGVLEDRIQILWRA